MCSWFLASYAFKGVLYECVYDLHIGTASPSNHRPHPKLATFYIATPRSLANSEHLASLGVRSPLGVKWVSVFTGCVLKRDNFVQLR
jgi:hypothetical protein